MGIILVAGIVAFYFFNKKKMTFGEWVRQLHILLKLLHEFLKMIIVFTCNY